MLKAAWETAAQKFRRDMLGPVERQPDYAALYAQYMAALDALQERLTPSDGGVAGMLADFRSFNGNI